jgi:hypothetical protein
MYNSKPIPVRLRGLRGFLGVRLGHRVMPLSATGLRERGISWIFSGRGCGLGDSTEQSDWVSVWDVLLVLFKSTLEDLHLGNWRMG